MISTAVFAVIAALMYTLLKQRSPEFSVVAEVFSACSVLIFIIPELLSLMNFAQDFFDMSGMGEYFSAVLRVTGIAVITQFASDICHDAGQSALSSQIEFAGRIMMIVCILPLIRTVLAAVSVFTG